MSRLTKANIICVALATFALNTFFASAQSLTTRQEEARVLDLVNRADAARSRGDMKASRSLFSQALSIAQASQNPRLQAIKDELQGALRLHDAQELLPEAKRLLEQAGRDYQSGNTLKSDAAMLRAEKLLDQAGRIADTAIPSTVLDGMLRSMADLYNAVDRHADAKRIYEQLLAKHRKRFGANSQQVGDILAQLGWSYSELGEKAKSISLLEEAIEINQRRPKELIAPVHNLAAVYLMMDNGPKALDLFQKALALEREHGGEDVMPEIIMLTRIASIHLFSFQDRSKAKEVLDKIAKLIEEVPPDRPGAGDLLLECAEIKLAVKDFAGALELYHQALKLLKEHDGERSGAVAAALNGLSGCYAELGNFSEAIAHAQKALEISTERLGQFHPQATDSTSRLARLWRQTNQNDAAYHMLQRSLKGREKQLQAILKLDEKSRLAWTARSLKLSCEPEILPAGELAEYVLSWKGVVLDSLCKDRAIARSLGTSRKGASLLGELSQLRSKLSSLAFSGLGGGNNQYNVAAQQISEVERKIAAMGVGTAGQSSDKNNLSDVVTSLGVTSALVEFFRFDNRTSGPEITECYGALLISGQEPPRFIRIGEAKTVDAAIDELRECVLSDQPDKLETLLHTLTQAIWQPVSKSVSDSVTQLIISPDGKLNFLPFGVLQAKSGGFLAESYKIAYVGSGRDLARKPSSETAKSLIVFADPVFDTSGKMFPAKDVVDMRSPEADVFGMINLPPLPGTKAEAEQLEVIAAGAGWNTKTYTGEEATESSVRETKRPGVLHLATHGFYLNSLAPSAEGGMRGMSVVDLKNDEGKNQNEEGVDPMRASGVALTGAQQTLKLWSQRKAPDPENDGILTAEEVAALELNGTWLVTLSACETGVGEARSGEGVFGLRRAFMMAGAENLLMTLWPVADDTTAQIMADFYKEALATGDAHGALAKVQRHWLVKLREEKGLAVAIREAGAFAMVAMVNPDQTVSHLSAGRSSAAPIDPMRSGQSIIALETAKLLAESGDAYAQAVLAMSFSLGYGTAADEERAKHYVMASAKSKNPLGTYWLSFMRGSGIGMEKNTAQAKQLQNQALPALQAMGDDPYALYALSRIEQQTNKNTKKATNLMKRSAELGFAPAQLDYALILLKNTSDPEVKAEAKKYWELARGQQYSQALQMSFSP
jgi:CHAT domain-containing protein/tetratricopeptide (TPR) repeat protein